MAGLKLEAFKPRVIDVEIREGDTVVLSVSLGALSWSEYHDIGMTVPNPEAPMKRDFDGKTIVNTPDYESPEYLRAANEAAAERKRRRLAVALVKGGNLPEFKDKTLEEQAAAIDEFDVSIVRVLYAALDDMVFKARREVEQAADNFRPAHVAGDEGLRSKRVVAGPVAGAAGGGA